MLLFFFVVCVPGGFRCEKKQRSTQKQTGVRLKQVHQHIPCNPNFTHLLRLLLLVRLAVTVTVTVTRVSVFVSVFVTVSVRMIVMMMIMIISQCYSPGWGRHPHTAAAIIVPDE